MSDPRFRVVPYAWAVDPDGQPYLAPIADREEIPPPLDFQASATAVPIPDSSAAAGPLGGLKLLPAVYPSFFPPYSRTVHVFVFPLTNIAINVAPASTVTLGVFTVPVGYVGRIVAIGMAGADMANLRWDFLVNGAAVPPITGLVLQYGTITAPTTLLGPGIVLTESDTCELRVTNIGAGIIANVQARADGYLWNPTKEPS